MTQESSWQSIADAEKRGALTRYTFATQAKPIREYYIPDIHFPYQNDDAVAYIIDACRGADLIHFIGDNIDADSIMTHIRPPDRKTTLFQQSNMFVDRMLNPICHQNPNAKVQVGLGNHEEDRLNKFIATKCPELADMPGLAWSELYRTKENGAIIVPRSGILVHGKRVKHGDVAKQGAGNSARQEMINHRIDGISGHTHRYALVQYTDKEGRTTKWAEIGHAMDTSIGADYVKGEPDWCLSGGLEVIRGTDGTEKWVEHRLQ